MNTTTSIIKTYARNAPHMHESMQWRIVQEVLNGNVRYYAEEWFDINKLTPEERFAYDAEVEGIPDFATEQDSDWDEHMRAQIPRFATTHDAEAWASVEDAEQSLCMELDAFHAPSECNSIAYRGLNARRAELLKRSI